VGSDGVGIVGEFGDCDGLVGDPLQAISPTHASISSRAQPCRNRLAVKTRNRTSNLLKKMRAEPRS
jgi:hypothetical protein